MSIEGWAVVDAAGIGIKTVSDTRRAAIVNWLVVEKNYVITNGCSDDLIESAWERMRGEADAARVYVSASPPPLPGGPREEDIARIIDPRPWNAPMSWPKEWEDDSDVEHARLVALQKARAVLQLFPALENKGMENCVGLPVANETPRSSTAVAEE